MQVITITPAHPIFKDVTQLRYDLFFREYKLPFDLATDTHEATSTHLALVTSENALVAYGRLTDRSFNTAIISQMVVQLNQQKRGFGTQIMQALLDEARLQNFTAVELAARQAAIGFYKRLGFRPISPSFSSSTTGHPHTQMRLDL